MRVDDAARLAEENDLASGTGTDLSVAVGPEGAPPLGALLHVGREGGFGFRFGFRSDTKFSP